MFLGPLFIKLLLTTVTIMKWKSDSPVTIVLVPLKHFPLLFNIRSIQRGLSDLKQVGALPKLANL